MNKSGMIDFEVTEFFKTLKTCEKCSKILIEGSVWRAISIARFESAVLLDPVITTVLFKTSNKALKVSLSHLALF